MYSMSLSIRHQSKANRIEVDYGLRSLMEGEISLGGWGGGRGVCCTFLITFPYLHMLYFDLHRTLEALTSFPKTSHVCLILQTPPNTSPAVSSLRPVYFWDTAQKNRL
jgi:hypothetical protein